MAAARTSRRFRLAIRVVGLVVALAAIAVGVSHAQGPQTPAAQSTKLRFAVIGDYGIEGQAVGQVADLVKGWQPDLVITTGDNNYPDGAASTIDRNIGRHYAQFIAPYNGEYGPGGTRNRFFPSLGNHDWETPGAQPYLNYFTLPGNERYYDFTWGSVHFFALDSDRREPDGVTADSRQAAWLHDRLETSRAVWRVVYMHHPPYSSGDHGSTPDTQWPYEEWGATAVLAGHDHSYERVQVGGIPYFVNGLGGAQPYEFREVLEGSRARLTGTHGAMLVEATAGLMTYRFYTKDGELADTFQQCREWEWRPGVEECAAGAFGGRSR